MNEVYLTLDGDGLQSVCKTLDVAKATIPLAIWVEIEPNYWSNINPTTPRRFIKRQEVEG